MARLRGLHRVVGGVGGVEARRAAARGAAVGADEARVLRRVRRERPAASRPSAVVVVGARALDAAAGGGGAVDSVVRFSAVARARGGSRSLRSRSAIAHVLAPRSQRASEDGLAAFRCFGIAVGGQTV